MATALELVEKYASDEGTDWDEFTDFVTDSATFREMFEAMQDGGLDKQAGMLADEFQDEYLEYAKEEGMIDED